MYKFLIFFKGQSGKYVYWHSFKSLSTVYKHVNSVLSPETDILILERKSLLECVFRICRFSNGRFIRSSWIDLSDDVFSEVIYKYAEEHIDDYVKFYDFMLEAYGDKYSIAEWALENDIRIRDIILWMYSNGYFSFDVVK